MLKPEKLDDWKRGQKMGHQGLFGEESRELEKLKERASKGMTSGEVNQLERAIEQAHAAIRAKFLRKCDEIDDCETVKQVDQKTWSA